MNYRDISSRLSLFCSPTICYSSYISHVCVCHRTWISNVICLGFFGGKGEGEGLFNGFVLLIWVELLTITV